MLKSTFGFSGLLALCILGSACQPMPMTLKKVKDLTPPTDIINPAPVDTTTDIKADLLIELETRSYRECLTKDDLMGARYFLYQAIFMSNNSFFEEITEHSDDQCSSPISSSSHYLQYTVTEIKRVDANNNYNMKITPAWLGNNTDGIVFGQSYNEMMAFLSGNLTGVFANLGDVITLPINIASDYSMVTYLQGTTTIPLPELIYVAPPPDLLAYIEQKSANFENFALCESVVRSGVTKHFYHSFRVGYNRGGYFYNFVSIEAVDAICSDTSGGVSITQTMQIQSATSIDTNYVDYDFATSSNIQDELGDPLNGLAYNSTMEFLSGSTGTFASGNIVTRITMSSDWRSLTIPIGARNITLTLPPSGR